MCDSIISLNRSKYKYVTTQFFSIFELWTNIHIIAYYTFVHIHWESDRIGFIICRGPERWTMSAKHGTSRQHIVGLVIPPTSFTLSKWKSGYLCRCPPIALIYREFHVVRPEWVRVSFFPQLFFSVKFFLIHFFPSFHLYLLSILLSLWMSF